MRFGLIIVGDEILSGRREDKHLAKAIELLGARGLGVAWARYLGDEPPALRAALHEALAGAEPVFSFGGIGATPDDHTRQAVADALGRPLRLHPGARDRIQQRIREQAAAQGLPPELDRPDNLQRLQMGCFPEGAGLIENPYNRIPGFECQGPGGAWLHCLPGFPVMAWPMMEAVLDGRYRPHFGAGRMVERALIVPGALEAALTPLMLEVEARHPGVKVFSLPSMEHPVHGRHIELGVKGGAAASAAAFDTLRAGLRAQGLSWGPETVRGLEGAPQEG